jgi:hypothetical protein
MPLDPRLVIWQNEATEYAKFVQGDPMDDHTIADLRHAISMLDLKVFRGFGITFSIRMENMPKPIQHPDSERATTIDDVANLF